MFGMGDGAQGRRLPVTRQLSAGAIIYYTEEGTTYVVLLEQSNKFYKRTGKYAKRRIMDMGPCGRVNADEPIKEAAEREIGEEIGLKLKIKEDFVREFSYDFEAIAFEGKYKGKLARIRKTRRYFAIGVSKEQVDKIKLSEEHIMYFAMPIDKAIASKYMHPGQKRVLAAFKRWIDDKKKAI